MPRRLALLVTLAACGPERVAERPLADRQALRPTDTSTPQMFRFEPTDVVSRYGLDGGHFAVHFSRSGRHQTLARDVNDSGVPDFVEEVARVYEEVEAAYRSWGFREALRDGALSSNGGDDRFDVYLLDFSGSADGAFRTDACLSGTERCIGFMVQENDFVEASYPSTEEATRILGSHEFFHAVQAAYDTGQDSMLGEGTAVWATEEFDPASNDFENFIGAFLRAPERSLDAPNAGPIPASAYGAAIFFRFLSERHGRQIVPQLWGFLENGAGHPSEPSNRENPTWLVQLDAILKASHGSSLATELEQFAIWNLFTGPAADPSKSYREGAKYPTPAMTTLNAPARHPLRVFYASTQFFRVPVAGRATITAALVEPDASSAETRGLSVVAVSRRAGRNVDARLLGPPLDTSTADEVIVAVVNGARGPDGTVLSRRPVLCVGSPAEVAACAGPVDAGTAEADAGVMTPLAPGPLPAAPTGCTQGMSPPLGTLLVGLLFLLRRRKP